MKRVLQIILLLVTFLFSVFGAYLIYIFGYNRNFDLLQKPSFLFFLFIVFCSLLSAFYKLSYTRSLLSRKRSNEQIIDIDEFVVPEEPILQNSILNKFFFIGHLTFGLGLIASGLLIFDFMDHQFSSDTHFRTHELGLVLGLFIFGIVVLIDAILTRPWKKINSTKE